MLLDMEKPGEQDKERSEEWLVNTDRELIYIFVMGLRVNVACCKFVSCLDLL